MHPWSFGFVGLPGAHSFEFVDLPYALPGAHSVEFVDLPSLMSEKKEAVSSGGFRTS